MFLGIVKRSKKVANKKDENDDKGQSLINNQSLVQLNKCSNSSVGQSN